MFPEFVSLATTAYRFERHTKQKLAVPPERFLTRLGTSRFVQRFPSSGRLRKPFKLSKVRHSAFATLFLWFDPSFFLLSSYYRLVVAVGGARWDGGSGTRFDVLNRSQMDWEVNARGIFFFFIITVFDYFYLFFHGIKDDFDFPLL